MSWTIHLFGVVRDSDFHVVQTFFEAFLQGFICNRWQIGVVLQFAKAPFFPLLRPRWIRNDALKILVRYQLEHDDSVPLYRLGEVIGVNIPWPRTVVSANQTLASLNFHPVNFQ